MGNEHPPIKTARVVKSARPWSGLILGVILGVAVAVLLQQSGVWPLDRLLLYGSAGLIGLVGILLASAGRQRVGAFNSVVPLILAVALIAFGATGLGSVNQQGEINGGCTLQATSDIDGTVVTDTSRQDPFEIDPDGSLSWTATSPEPITNHFWNIWVDVGGFQVTLADNDQAELNTDLATENSGSVDDLKDYIDEATEISGIELSGILQVGGDITGDGGNCDGFGFVRLVSDPLTSLIAQIAAGVGLIALISLLVLTFRRTREAELVPEPIPDETSYVAAGSADTGAEAAGAAAAGGVIGAHERRDEPLPVEEPPPTEEDPPVEDQGTQPGPAEDGS